MPASAYIGKCRTKGCRHATRVAGSDVQELDSYRRCGRTPGGHPLYTTPSGAPYDPARPFIMNGVAVMARCPDHGVYRLAVLRGSFVPDHKCDASCMGATGPQCDCSCGGANHGASHAR